MIPSLLHGLLSLSLSIFIATFTNAQSSTGSGYSDYSLTFSGDEDSVLYSTASTPANVSSTFAEPDVFLNATVNVGEIDINVSNLTAKINLDAQVLQLLRFNAGVDLSIDRVSLLIANVSAKVLLEARLENLVRMINDTLDSIDLNPVLATLGQEVGSLVGDTVDGLTGSGGGTSPLPSIVTPRSYELDNNILYSINDYSGNTHTNRILTQGGDIVDEFLDNDGNTQRRQPVGSYSTDMTFNGSNQSAVVGGGQVARELEYVYTPFDGLSVVSAIYVDDAGTVLATQVLSESGGGGSSTIGGP
jgi:hypothetical protein